MITLIEALGFRCLRDVALPLGRFHVLVGPNASGKTTLLDVIAFLGRLVSDGLDAAIEERTSNPIDLVFGKNGNGFQLAIEAAIPADLRGKVARQEWDTARYEIGVGLVPDLHLSAERLSLFKREEPKALQYDAFPRDIQARTSLLSKGGRRDVRTVLAKAAGGNDRFNSETYPKPGKGWVVAYKLGPKRSALGNLPEDETKFPVATWLRQLLETGVQKLVLNSLLIRNASPPTRTTGFRPDGSNLPWVVASLEKDADTLAEWIEHLRTALPDLEGIRTVERPDDKHRYLLLRYAGGLEIPSWMASDGTLRMLALTLPAYLPAVSGIYLIEEPENGIHPRAVETVFQSLSSMYQAQVILASHSPIVLGLSSPSDVLCFAKNSHGATDIVRGSEHPLLTKWKGETSLGTLFASGVLG